MIASKLAAVLALALAAASPALSTLVATSPVASTTGRGGKKLDVEWKDDGTSPKISSDWGSVNIFLATGSHDVQFKLQELGTAVSPSKTSGSYTIDPSVGPDGGYYFIRFEGTNAAANGIPPMAFSARFTLKGMSGQFNSTVMAELSGPGGTVSSGGAASSTATIRASTQTVGTSRTLTTTTTRSSSAQTVTGTPASASSTSGAMSNRVAGISSLIVGALAVGAALV
ncbi:hypothetical protein IE53DRAFT_373529 [Violaceomyces palustris]|uniref:Uncharacterized protein n=1 Tax=Violaceomyces palustris TaxID=1673888 RepID=A0ACD0P310_9BASI|nr:hypothetical protein IE53DRAFT_373529 [Violaceomyces palustris]